MTKSQTLPPDITVTRADVLALPICGGDSYYEGRYQPDDGHIWTLALVDGRSVWVEAPEGSTPDERAKYANDGVGGTGWLTEGEAVLAERAFLWQTALASDAALADIGNDPAPTAPPIMSAPSDLLATIRKTIADETATAIRRASAGVKA